MATIWSCPPYELSLMFYPRYFQWPEYFAICSQGSCVASKWLVRLYNNKSPHNFRENLPFRLLIPWYFSLDIDYHKIFSVLFDFGALFFCSRRLSRAISRKHCLTNCTVLKPHGNEFTIMAAILHSVQFTLYNRSNLVKPNKLTFLLSVFI